MSATVTFAKRIAAILVSSMWVAECFAKGIGLSLTYSVCRPGPTDTPQASTRVFSEDDPWHDPIARQLSLQRYRILMQIQSRLGTFPLDRALEGASNALFPAGRADKVYIIFLNDGGKLLCYEAKGTTSNLKFSIKLKTVARPPLKGSAKSVLDCVIMRGTVRGGSYVPSTRLTKIQRDELSKQQELILYSYTPVTSTLFVSPASRWIHGDPCRQNYFLEEDPISGTRLKIDEFFKKYGLPVADEEFAKIRHKQ